MTLQSSGQITLGNIATEFGGSAPHSLSEYYRGGANVPNIAQNNSVPTSGQITVGNFYGTVKMVNHTTSISQSNVTDYCVFETPYIPTCLCSQNLTANPVNGSGSFTYSWARISGDTQMTLVNASSQTCTVQSINPSGIQGYYSATFRVTVTDTGNSNYQTTTDITISHTHDGF